VTLVGVAGFEPAASSSRSKRRTLRTCPLPTTGLRGVCTGVRWCFPVILTVITQIVTRPCCTGQNL
jgi:hypothetical protein